MTERLACLSQSFKTDKSSRFPSDPAKSRRMDPTSPRSAIVSCSSRGSSNSYLPVKGWTRTSRAKHTHIWERAYILFVHFLVSIQVLLLAEFLNEPLIRQFPRLSIGQVPRLFLPRQFLWQFSRQHPWQHPRQHPWQFPRYRQRRRLIHKVQNQNIEGISKYMLTNATLSMR